jgi:hypothetical protein
MNATTRATAPVSIPFAIPEPFPYIDVDVTRPRRIRVRMLPLADLLALPSDLQPERYYLAGSVAMAIEVMPIPGKPVAESEPAAPTIRPDARPAILPFSRRSSRAAL